MKYLKINANRIKPQEKIMIAKRKKPEKLYLENKKRKINFLKS